MPLEKKPSENKNDFVSRCIKHYIDKGRTQEQSVGMCESIWTTMERNEYLKEMVRRIRELKGKKKKKC